MAENTSIDEKKLDEKMPEFKSENGSSLQKTDYGILL